MHVQLLNWWARLVENSPWRSVLNRNWYTMWLGDAGSFDERSLMQALIIGECVPVRMRLSSIVLIVSTLDVHLPTASPPPVPASPDLASAPVVDTPPAQQPSGPTRRSPRSPRPR